MYWPSADPGFELGRWLIGVIQLPAYVASKPKFGMSSGPFADLPRKLPALPGDVVIAVILRVALVVSG